MLSPFRIVATGVALSLCILAYAEQTALTQTDVRNVIDAVKELKREVDKENAYDFEQMTQLGAYIKGQEVYNKYLNILRKHGFADPAKWAETVTRVFQAYGAYKVQLRSPKMETQMQQAIAQIENNPNLTAEQKEQMLQMMRQHNQSMRAYVSASSADIAAVKPFVAEIDATFGK